MKENNRESIRVSLTLYNDTNKDIYALLSQAENSRTEVLRRLLEFAINQFPKNTLNAQNILNGSFYYVSNSHNRNHTGTTSNDNDVIDKEKVGKIASNINF